MRKPAAGFLLLLAACDAPSVLRPRGAAAGEEATLGWVLLVIAAVVVVIVSALVTIAAFRRHRETGDLVQPVKGETHWITFGGLLIPAVILVGVFVLTMFTLRALARPSDGPVTITITGHQWWWELRYDDGGGAPFTTANEIHIPVGQRVRLHLRTGDVIHSFWVPELAGKTDLIPGRKNTMWIEADSAGTYRGQCAEYCGLQHAHMAIQVVAEPEEQYAAWATHQRAPAAEPVDRDTWMGRQAFAGSGCAACHTVRGTRAQGIVGPDLTHVASRKSLAAGTLPNTRGWLAGWIVNAQSLKPGAHMPNLNLDAEQLQAVLAYVEHLR